MNNVDGFPIIPIDKIIKEKNVIEAHDYAMISVQSSRPERFETNARVEIFGNTDYVVQADRVTKLTDELYQHDIALLENLARFDKVIPSERVFSKVTIVEGQIELMTLGEIFDVYKTELEFYEKIDIDLAEGTWQDAQIPLKEFSGGVNLTTIMFDLFRRIKANPKVARDGDTWVFYPQFWYTRGSNVAGQVSALESELKHTNSEDYATEVKSLIKNGSSELVESVVFPSPNGYIKPKSFTPIARPSQLRYELDSPIIGIVKVVAVDVPVFDVAVIEPDTVLDEVDITKRVLTQEEYDVLLPAISAEAKVGINKRNCVIYEIGSRFINSLFTVGGDTVLGFFPTDTDHLINAIDAALADGEIVYNTLWTTAEVQLRIEYIRERNANVSAHRQFKGFMNDTTTTHNQRDSRVEVNRFKANLDLLANRLGNVERSITLTKEVGEPLIDVFDYVGSEVVVEVKNTEWDEYVMQEIKLVENFATANAEYAISRRLEPFTITSKRLTTNVIINDFVEVSKISKDITSILNQRGRETFLKTFNNNQDAEPINAAVYQFGGETIHMPVMTMGGGNITAHAYFDHPRRAGVDFSDEFGEPINYTDEDGVVDEFIWYLAEQADIEDDGSYPRVDDAIYDGKTQTDPSPFPIDKDPLAALAVTYQLNPQVDDKRFIVGEAFSRFNFLLGVRDLTFGVYTKATPYTYQDGDIGTLVSGATFSFDLATRKLTFTTTTTQPRFALVANGEIMLAFNELLGGGNVNEYYLNFLSNIETQFLLLGEANGLNINFVLGVAESVKQENQEPEMQGININFVLGKAQSEAQLEVEEVTKGLNINFALGEADSQQGFVVTWLPNGGTWGDNTTTSKTTFHTTSKEFTNNDAPDTISRDGFYLTAWRVDGDPLPQIIGGDETIEATWAQTTQLPTPVWQSLTATQTSVTAVVDNNNIDNEFDGVRTQIRFFGTNKTTDWITLVTSNSRVVNINKVFQEPDFTIDPDTSYTLQIRNISTVVQHTNSGTSTLGVTTPAWPALDPPTGSANIQGNTAQITINNDNDSDAELVLEIIDRDTSTVIHTESTVIDANDTFGFAINGQEGLEFDKIYDVEGRFIAVPNTNRSDSSEENEFIFDFSTDQE